MLTKPDDSYHGTIFAEHFSNAAFIAKARLHVMRDLGLQMSPFNGFLLNLGLETLHLRMPRHSENGLAVAKWLENDDMRLYIPEAEGQPRAETFLTVYDLDDLDASVEEKGVGTYILSATPAPEYSPSPELTPAPTYDPFAY